MHRYLRFDRIATGLAVSAGALMTCWPAVLNRYPLIYFGDSIFYFRDGAVVAKALLHRDLSVYAERSEIYSLGILLWHWNRSAWPVVALQALLASYLVWLVTRSIAPRRVYTVFFVLMALLSTLTSMSWYASTMMPDILGGPLYLGMYLLLFARETLSTVERWCLWLIMAWSESSHATHLIVAAGLWAVFTALLVGRWRPIAQRRRTLAEIAALIGVVVIAQYGLHDYLYGQPSLNGHHPPFLMARVVADGPGMWYLQNHCRQLDWYVCGSVNDPPQSADEFLWGPHSLWDNRSPSDQQRLLDEEKPLVLGAVRNYPWAEIRRALANVTVQLESYYQITIAAPTQPESLYKFVPGARSGYQRSLQIRDALPTALFAQIHHWVVVGSCAILMALAPILWRRRRERLIGLAVVIGAAIVANAFATAVLSGPVSRYEERIIWLVPMLAGLAAFDVTARRAARDLEENYAAGSPENPGMFQH